jgi:hypothetical protein
VKTLLATIHVAFVGSMEILFIELFPGYRFWVTCGRFPWKAPTVLNSRLRLVSEGYLTPDNNNNNNKKTDTAIPATCRGGQQLRDTSRPPHFLQNRLADGDEALIFARRPRFTNRKNSGTHFC